MIFQRALSRWLGMSVVILAILPVPPVAGQVFPDPPRYATNEYPNEIVVADFNRDGNWDVATIDDLYVSVLLGRADGTFRDHVDYLLGSNFGHSIVVGDFNGDGYPDLAVVSDPNDILCRSDRGFMSVFINKGDGTFGPREDYSPLGCYANGVVTGDFNHDGKLDLAIVVQLGPNLDNPGDIEVFLGNGDGTFQNPRGYTAQTNPWKLVAGDFNRDGNLDLAVSNLSNQPPISLFFGNSDGTFQQRVDFGTPSDLEDENIVAADFNNDGNLDLAIGTQVASVFLGNGDGTFRPQIDTQVAGLLGTLTAGDFNGDGIPDLIGGFYGYLAVLLGNGDGTFQAGNIYAWPEAFATAVDLNHDGKLDLVASGPGILGGVIGVFRGNSDGTFQNANRSFQLPGFGSAVADFNGDGILDAASTNAVMLGNGDGTFQPATAFLSGNLQFESVTSGDFNGDGKPDLAVASNENVQLTSSVKVFLGKGDGTFRPEVDYSVPYWPSSLISVDLNRDQIPDLAIADTAGYATVLLGNGDGSFQSAVNFPTAGPPSFIAAGDFDGDGMPDLVTATTCTPSGCTGGISLLRGNGDGTFQAHQDFDLSGEALALAAGDFNGDGKLDLAVTIEAPDGSNSELAIFIGNGDGTFQAPTYYDIAGFAGLIQVADFNGDGKLDLAISSATILSLFLGNGDGTFSLTQDIVGGCAGVADFNADGKLDVIMNGNIVLNIADIPSFTFSIDLTGTGTGAVIVVPGFVCNGSCSHDYARGANLTLTAKASTGSTFSGWSGGGCSGTGACNITISTNTSITATFDITPDFAVSASALSPGTVNPGQTSSSTISVTAAGGFNSSVALTCSVSPTPQLAPQCSISPSSVSPGTPAILTVTTVGTGARLLSPPQHAVIFAAALPFLGAVLVGGWQGSRKRQRAVRYIVLCLGVTVGLSVLVACGGGGGSGNSGGNGTPAGTYTITIKGASGTTQHTTSTTLTVQ